MVTLGLGLGLWLWLALGLGLGLGSVVTFKRLNRFFRRIKFAVTLPCLPADITLSPR